jgi:hypothetical protein
MNGFFQLVIAWGVLLVFVLMLYMIDKLNFVFNGFSEKELPETYTDGLFGELYGKPLWDAMSGLPIPGIEKKLVENLKPHYEPVLRQHIEQVFMEGYQHAREGKLGVPSNNRMIPTPRGTLESWLPLHHLTSIYQSGAEFFNKPDSDLMRIQQNLDQITSMLYARVGISLIDPYSRTLMVHPLGVERPFANAATPSEALATEAMNAVQNAAQNDAQNATLSAAQNSASTGATQTNANAEKNPEINAQINVENNPLNTTPVGAGTQTSAVSQTTQSDETLIPSAQIEQGVSEDLLIQPNLTNLSVDSKATVAAELK